MHTPHRRSVAGRVIAVAAVAIAAWSFGLSSSASGARPTSESPAVAASAQRALDALATWRESHLPAQYVRYVRARDRAAELLAADFGASGDALAREWAASDDRQQVAVLSALTQLGVPYRSLARKPGIGFDCSGLTSWAWAEAGIEIPRSSRYQIRAADEVDGDEAEAGDLVYYPGHVSLYVGQGFMVQSPATGSNVQVVPLPTRRTRIGDPVTAEALQALERAQHEPVLG